MKYLILIVPFLFFSQGAFAVDDVSFFGQVGQTVTDIKDFVGGVPDFLSRGLAAFVEVYVLWQIKSQIWFAVLAYDTAKVIMEDLNVTTMVNQAFTNIPPSMGHYMNLFEIPNCATYLLDCVATRVVMTSIGGR